MPTEEVGRCRPQCCPIRQWLPIPFLGEDTPLAYLSACWSGSTIESDVSHCRSGLLFVRPCVTRLSTEYGQ